MEGLPPLLREAMTGPEAVWAGTLYNWPSSNDGCDPSAPEEKKKGSLISAAGLLVTPSGVFDPGC